MSLLNTYGSSNSNNSGSATQGDLSKDIEVPQNQLPSDSISDMAFSPTNDYLAVASWDCKVRIYEVSNLGVQGKWAFEMKGPVLAVAWAPVCLVAQLHDDAGTWLICRREGTGRHAGGGRVDGQNSGHGGPAQCTADGRR